eukprot:1276033-Pleurochrysis_carterae.AAC.3
MDTDVSVNPPPRFPFGKTALAVRCRCLRPVSRAACVDSLGVAMALARKLLCCDPQRSTHTPQRSAPPGCVCTASYVLPSLR